MQQKTSAFRKKLSEQEGRIALAISAIKDDNNISVRTAAKSFNVPRATLQARMNGVKSRVEMHPVGCTLTRDEEEVLEKWVRDNTAAKVPPILSDVRAKADLILTARAGKAARPVGRDWLRNFISRHPEIFSKQSRSYDMKNGKSQDPNVIFGWFDLVEKTIKERGIHQDDIYYFNETVFALRATYKQKISTGSDFRGSLKVMNSGNRDWATAIECVSSRGWVLSPTIIFKGKKALKKWTQNIPYGWEIDLSANGRSSNNIALRWLKESFLPQTKEAARGKYRLLISDGHGSHVTEEFSDISRENNVITLCIPPHFSQFLQPLDFSYFGPLKKAYNDLVDYTKSVGRDSIDKIEFLEMFTTARYDALNFTNIKTGFRDCGLLPFDPDQVISKLDHHPEPSTPVPSPVRACEPSIPKNPSQVRLKIDKIKSLMLEVTDTIPSPLQLQIEQLGSGYTKALYEIEILKDENRKLLHELNRNIKKDDLSSWGISSEGDLSPKAIQPVFPQALEAEEARQAPYLEPTCDNSESPTKPN